MYSALKKDAGPCTNIPVPGKLGKAARRVTIHELLLDCTYAGTTGFSMRVRCGKGTYIRTLAEDIGEAPAVVPT